jgi:hypothetical protein
MKSFSQFLQESYLNEEPAGRPARRRTGGPTPEEVKAQIDAKEAEKAARAAARQPSGAAARPDLQFKKTAVPSPARNPGDPWNQFPRKPEKQLGIPTSGPSSQVPGRTLAPAGGTTTRPALPPSGSTARGGALAVPTSRNPGIPDAMIRGAQDAAYKPSPTPVAPKQSLPSAKPPAATPSAKSALSAVGKPPSGPKLKLPKVPSGLGKVGRVAGKLVGPAAAALDVADERAKGSGWLRSGLKAATVAAGGALGGSAGSVAGPVGSIAGATGGAMAASKAFDVAAGANAVQRKAMATANRQAQSGGAIKGIGGKTTFDTKKNTITTGTGAQRRTAQLGKTSVVTGPGGKQDVGYLAYKGGKAVYKRADTKNLAQTSSNPLERIGRSLFAGAYKQSDAAAAAKKLATARASDVARNKALGVKMKPGG